MASAQLEELSSPEAPSSTAANAAVNRVQAPRLPEKKSWDSDRELVDEILGGNVEQFDLLYEAYFPRVY
ncbi:MAG: hypothetical protein ACI9QQ_000273, partial [Myxococcota bacterium]